MAVPTRRDKMYKNLMARNKRKRKEEGKEEVEKKEPKKEDVDGLINMWKKKKRDT